MIENGEDAKKEKKIKTDQAVFTMMCLNFVLDSLGQDKAPKV